MKNDPPTGPDGTHTKVSIDATIDLKIREDYRRVRSPKVDLSQYYQRDVQRFSREASSAGIRPGPSLEWMRTGTGRLLSEKRLLEGIQGTIPKKEETSRGGLQMGIRFRRRIRLAKGVHLNLSKTGVGISAGVPGARIGTGPRGAYRSVGIPGTGLVYFERLGNGGSQSPKMAEEPSRPPGTSAVPVPRSIRIPGWLWALSAGGILLLAAVPPAGSGMLLAAVFGWTGFVRSGRLKHNRLFHEAMRNMRQERLTDALDGLATLTDSMEPPDADVLLIKGRLERNLERWEDSVITYRRLLQYREPDAGLRLELVDALAGAGDAQKALEEAGRLPEEMRNGPSGVLIRAHLLMEAGRNDEALHLLRDRMGRKRKMTPELMQARYLMGIIYERQGDNKRALNQLQRVYAHDVHYRDVAVRIDRLSNRMNGTGNPSDN